MSCQLLLSCTIIFPSKLYSGSISDLQIIMKSGFFDNLEEGDDVMEDPGFNIRHLLLTKKHTLNIPTFTHGKKLSKRGLQRSLKIAMLRIYVE